MEFTPKQFNDVVLKFMDSMCETFKDEKKLFEYRRSIRFFITVDERKPVQFFMDSIGVFGTQIISKDEQFFKQDNIVNSAESFAGKTGLIDHWDSMNNETKEAIWEYVRCLYIIGCGITGKKEELEKILQDTANT